MSVCDFSDQGIDIAAVNANFDGAISYASDTTSKNWTQANFNAVLGGGKEVGIVCEQGQQPALRGAVGGTHDAQISNAQGNALGYDPAATIFYVAEDPTQAPPGDWPTIEAYFGAVNAAGGRPVGAYGGWATLNTLHGAGLIQKGWMVETWNQGAPATLPPWVVLMQMVNNVNTFGLPVDVDNVLQSDWGQMPRPSSPGGKSMISETIAFQNNQYDYFQASGGWLWHKWFNATTDGQEGNEAIAGPGAPAVYTNLTISTAQEPKVWKDSAGNCWVRVETASTQIAEFAQPVGSGSWGFRMVT